MTKTKKTRLYRNRFGKPVQIKGGYYIVNGRKLTPKQWADEVLRLATKALKGLDVPAP